MKKAFKSKKFRCGRAVLTKKGTVKKLDLEKGGGSRYIDWYNKFMNFDDVRDYLINLYNLGDTEDEISLYDYQLKPLDLEQYNTVWKYVHDNGLNCNSTLIYICTHEGGNDQSQKKIMKKKKKKNPEKESSSSATSIENQPIVKIEPDSDSQQIHLSSLDYSFKKSTRDFIDHIRDLVNQYPGDKLLVQLFEESCIMHGYVCSIIDPLQQNLYLQSRNSSQVLNSLNDIQTICESIEISLDLSKEKSNHFEHFSIINDLFVRFHQNFKNLRDQWVQQVETNNESDEASSSLVHLPSTSSNNQDDPTYSTPKRPNQEICSIFQPLLNLATDVLDFIPNSKRLSSFRAAIKWFITDLEFIRSNIDLYNYQSLYDTKQAVTSLQIRFTRKFNDQALKSSVYKFSDEVKQAHKKILRLIPDLLSTIRQYQRQLDENNQSSKVVKRKSEDQPLIPPKKIKLEKCDRDRKNQMDIAVYSSSDIS